jgi:hypothetical protein
MGLPHHPGHDDPTPPQTARSRGATAVIVGAVVVVLIVVVVLHLTGVISGH